MPPASKTQPIKVALLGVGNCASSLVQGIALYTRQGIEQCPGLLHENLGGYCPSDIQFVAALDIDRRKVGFDLAEAIFASPNCTTIFCPEIEPSGVTVQRGCTLDGVAEHMKEAPEEHSFALSSDPEPSHAQIIDLLKSSQAEILVNFLPVGSERATRFYVECALEAGVALVNCIPVFIASDPAWAQRFADKGLPIIGDDIKAQLGATITHRTLTDLFAKRGVALKRTYQLNTGGNTDFLNMKNQDRLASKKISKTEAVQSVAGERLEEENIHVGPSDYVPWQKDNKVCFLRMEGELFGGVPMNLELRLSVEDSPNSAAIVIDAIRCCKLALKRGQGGALKGPAAFYMKHPPEQWTDTEAYHLTEAFISGE
jgi:myo-inositol-1-phosphate synthase